MIIFYSLSFLAVYVQVFFLVTFIENRKKIFIRHEKLNLDHYPTTTIVVPCYNEEKTVAITLESLLSLAYPKDKLSIFVVDDGSRDNTWEILQAYKENPQIKLFKKENGGKHSAINWGIENATSEFVGCLDADSSVHPEALKRMMTYFDNPETMACAPSIVVRDPKTILQYAQAAEYDMSHYTKKMLAFLGGIHVTPGPFSIFRKKVFDTIGYYKKAHHTEDQEIALRMHRYGYKIDHCPDAYVYTGSPSSVPKLYRQRVRWIYGFIKNAIDYKDFFFKSKYGTIGIFTLPSGFVSIAGTVILLMFAGSRIYNFIFMKYMKIQATGFGSVFGNASFNFDPFFINTRAFLFISIILYSLVILALINGRRMIYGKKMVLWDIPLFMIIYSFIAPFWLLKAVWNVITSQEASWTNERDYLLTKKTL